MTQHKFTFLLVLLAPLLIDPLYGEELPPKNGDLDQAYLSHWFSYDSAEQANLTISSLDDDAYGKRDKIRFISDDGQAVNGVIAFPKGKTSSNKIAIALHPMGMGQEFWWSDKSPLGAHEITARLRGKGYIVLSLDARRHGERSREGFGPRELIKRAHSKEPRLYIDTIIGSVRDYRIVLDWAKSEFKAERVLAVGYSMGAQMSLILASFEPSVNAVIAMVPPYVGSPTSPVAPRVHSKRITQAKVLWLAGTNDPHSDREQTQEAFDKISSKDKTLTWFDAGHRLPTEYLDAVLPFIESLDTDSSDIGSISNGGKKQ